MTTKLIMNVRKKRLSPLAVLLPLFTVLIFLNQSPLSLPQGIAQTIYVTSFSFSFSLTTTTMTTETFQTFSSFYYEADAKPSETTLECKPGASATILFYVHRVVQTFASGPRGSEFEIGSHTEAVGLSEISGSLSYEYKGVGARQSVKGPELTTATFDGSNYRLPLPLQDGPGDYNLAFVISKPTSLSKQFNIHFGPCASKLSLPPVSNVPCGSTTSLTLTLTGYEDQPISGGRISLEGQGPTGPIMMNVETNSRGVADFPIPFSAPGAYQLTAKYDGVPTIYDPSSSMIQIAINQGKTNVNIDTVGQGGGSPETGGYVQVLIHVTDQNGLPINGMPATVEVLRSGGTEAATVYTPTSDSEGTMKILHLIPKSNSVQSILLPFTEENTQQWTIQVKMKGDTCHSGATQTQNFAATNKPASYNLLATVAATIAIVTLIPSRSHWNDVLPVLDTVFTTKSHQENATS